MWLMFHVTTVDRRAGLCPHYRVIKQVLIGLVVRVVTAENIRIWSVRYKDICKMSMWRVTVQVTTVCQIRRLSFIQWHAPLERHMIAVHVAVIRLCDHCE